MRVSDHNMKSFGCDTNIVDDDEKGDPMTAVIKGMFPVRQRACFEITPALTFAKGMTTSVDNLPMNLMISRCVSRNGEF